MAGARRAGSSGGVGRARRRAFGSRSRMRRRRRGSRTSTAPSRLAPNDITTGLVAGRSLQSNLVSVEKLPQTLPMIDGAEGVQAGPQRASLRFRSDAPIDEPRRTAASCSKSTRYDFAQATFGDTPVLKVVSAAHAAAADRRRADARRAVRLRAGCRGRQRRSKPCSMSASGAVHAARAPDRPAWGARASASSAATSRRSIRRTSTTCGCAATCAIC